MDIELIATDEFYEGIDPNSGLIEGLMESILKNRQVQPVTIAPNPQGPEPYRIVDGRKRLFVHKQLAKDNKRFRNIPAHIEKMYKDETRLELARIDTMLLREELHPVAYGKLLAQKKQIYETLYPDSAKTGKKVTDKMAKTFIKSHEETTGMNERTAYRFHSAATSIPDDVAENVIKLNLPMSDCEKLAKLPSGVQEKYVNIETAQEIREQVDRDMAEILETQRAAQGKLTVDMEKLLAEPTSEDRTVLSSARGVVERIAVSNPKFIEERWMFIDCRIAVSPKGDLVLVKSHKYSDPLTDGEKKAMGTIDRRLHEGDFTYHGLFTVTQINDQPDEKVMVNENKGRHVRKDRVSLWGYANSYFGSME